MKFRDLGNLSKYVCMDKKLSKFGLRTMVFEWADPTQARFWVA